MVREWDVLPTYTSGTVPPAVGRSERASTVTKDVVPVAVQAVADVELDARGRVVLRDGDRLHHEVLEENADLAAPPKARARRPPDERQHHVVVGMGGRGR